MKTKSIHRLLRPVLSWLFCLTLFSSVAAQDVVWRTTLDNDPAQRDTARGMVPLTNGDLVVGGQSGATATNNFIVYRLNGSTGAVMWTRTLSSGFGSDDVNDIIADPATGDTYICGRSGSASQQLNWYVMKINGSDGTNAWAAPYTFNQTNENDEPRALDFVQDGAVKNVVVVGSITNSGFPQGRIVKLNASTGALMWGTNVGQQLWSVVTDSSGNIFCGGETFAVANQATITKFNISGTQQWHQTYAPNGGGFNRWNKIALDATSGDVITGGLILGPASNNDIGTARYRSSDGAQLWSRLINGTFGAANDSCSSVTVDSGGDVYVTGFYRATSTNADWYAARLNIANGNTVWEKTYNGTVTGNEQLENLRVVGSTVYLAGYMRNTVAAAAARTMRVMKLDKSDGSTLLETDFLDRVGAQVVGNKALIVAANGDMIVSGDSGVTANTAEIARFGVVGGGGPVAPTVTTATQASVTHNSATLGGNVTADGGASITARGVVYSQTSLNANPQLLGANVTNLPHGSNTTGVFTVNAAGLAAGTPYSFAAYATNSAGTAYTTPVSTFTTTAAVAVTSLNRSNGSPTNATTVNWTLTFGSAVTGVSASNFTLSGAAAAGLSVGAPTTGNGGLTWNIPVNTGATDGALTLTLANSTGLSAAISTSLPFAGETYTIDKTPPTVVSVTRLTPTVQNTNLTTVTFRVAYSEPVALNAPAANRFQVVPVNGSNVVGTVTGVTGSGDTRDVTVNLTSGTGEFRLRVID
jgi:hypothetical protein